METTRGRGELLAAADVRLRLNERVDSFAGGDVVGAQLGGLRNWLRSSELRGVWLRARGRSGLLLHDVFDGGTSTSGEILEFFVLLLQERRCVLLGSVGCHVVRDVGPDFGFSLLLGCKEYICLVWY